MGHRWHFFRAGGVDQVNLSSGADLLALRELDQKLWVALAMPTRDVDIDPATLDLLDGDRDGRVRVPDILAAVDWIEATWVEPGLVLEGGDAIDLAAIRAPEVVRAAKRILTDAGKGSAISIGIDDVTSAAKAMAKTRFNGDGVVTPATAADAATKQAIEDVMATVGTVDDRSGAKGVDKAKVDAFYVQIDEIATWGAAEPHPLGDGTAAASAAFAAVKGKLEDYFTRCKLAAFDPRAIAGLNGQDADFASLDHVDRLPLARVEAVRPLPLDGGINPAWADRLAAFVEKAVTPICGKRDTLHEEDLAAIADKLGAHLTWMAGRPANAAGALPAERLRALASGPERAAIAALIADDAALADEYAAIASVEKLARFQRDFGRILRNFVNFAGFYSERDAVFQTGTLYIDGRACSLCVPVSDAGKHGALAGLSGAFLAYCDLVRGAEKRTIAVAITNGDADHLMVGRNAVFYDRAGKDWDATVSKIVSNPISVREAFWAPYKKLARMIGEQTSKRAAAADAAANARVEGAATAIAHADRTAIAVPTPAPKPEAKKIDVGVVAAIGVAIGGIGAMVVGILSMFFGLGMWMPIGIVLLLFLISGPSMMLAWLKLRQRNLGPILDANGWAINGRARVNVAFGAALTDLATLPPGAKRSLDDPYADKATPWRIYTFLILVVLAAGTWYVGRLDPYLPGPAKSTSVLGSYAPASAQVPLTPQR